LKALLKILLNAKQATQANILKKSWSPENKYGRHKCLP